MPPKKWMQDAFKHKGALHRQLGIPQEQPIGKRLLREIVNTPVGQLADHHRVTPLMKKRALAALNANQ